MSSPHVAGAAAVYFQQSNYQFSRIEVEAALLNSSTTNVINNVVGESTSTQEGTPNLMVFVEPCGEDSASSSSTDTTVIAVAIVIPLFFLLIFCITLIYCCYFRKGAKQMKEPLHSNAY